MSLVSCITASTQYTMMDSDCEDKCAELTEKLKSITEEGNDIGSMLSNINNQMDQIKYSYREVEGYRYQAMNSNDPKVRGALSEVQSRLNNYQNLYNGLQQRKIQLEYAKRKNAAMEKEITHQQSWWSTMKKFAQAAAQKFSGFIDGAIKRFFGG